VAVDEMSEADATSIFENRLRLHGLAKQANPSAQRDQVHGHRLKPAQGAKGAQGLEAGGVGGVGALGDGAAEQLGQLSCEDEIDSDESVACYCGQNVTLSCAPSSLSQWACA
jgi:hypothetical protein